MDNSQEKTDWDEENVRAEKYEADNPYEGVRNNQGNPSAY
jgi:hypothetical protein